MCLGGPFTRSQLVRGLIYRVDNELVVTLIMIPRPNQVSLRIRLPELPLVDKIDYGMRYGMLFVMGAVDAAFVQIKHNSSHSEPPTWKMPSNGAK